jgi:hypothetical protein
VPKKKVSTSNAVPRAKRGNPRLLTGNQLTAIALLAKGDMVENDIRKTVGINDQTWRNWKNQSGFMDKVYELQGQIAGDTLKEVQEHAKRKPIAKAPNPEIRERALKDFDFFRREFLGRKYVVCQKRWGNWFEKEARPVLLCPRNHGKSTVVVDYAIWRIINDRSIRILVLSKSSTLAERWVRSIKSILEGRGKYAKVVQYFGTFKPPGKPDKWTQNELIVEGASPEEPHPTLSCFGVTAALYGLRADLILCDDIVDRENAATEEQRDKLKDTFFSAIENILDAANGKDPKMIVIGTRKHPLDLYNDLINLEGFNVHVENAVKDWKKGRILCKELFDMAFFRDKLAKLGLKKFNREFQNASFDDRDVIVSSDSFLNDMNLDIDRSYGDMPFKRWYVIVAADPGTSTKKKETFQAVVVAVDPEDDRKRYLIQYVEDFVPSEDQPKYLCALYHKYGAGAMRIESNACQKYLMDSVVRESMEGGMYNGYVYPRFMVNVHPHFTSSTKLNDPIAGLETVGHYFEEGLWRLPVKTEVDQDRTNKFIDKITGYTYRERNKAHAVMCLWFAENEILEYLTSTYEAYYRSNVSDYLVGQEIWVDLRENNGV